MTESQFKRTIPPLQPVNGVPDISYVIANKKAVQILKQLRDVAGRGKTRVVVDCVNQYSCTFDQKMIEERRISCSKGQATRVGACGSLANLGMERAGNYFLDLAYGL